MEFTYLFTTLFATNYRRSFAFTSLIFFIFFRSTDPLKILFFFQEGSTLGLHLGDGHFRPASGGISRILPKDLPHLKAGLLQGPWSLGQSQPMHQV